MFYNYGTYTHAANEAQLAVHKRTTYSDRGYPLATRTTHTISGMLKSLDGTPQTLSTQLAALEAAYGANGFNAGLYFDQNLTQPTVHVINSGQSLGGTRVINIDYAPGDLTEFVTYRKYTITVEADFPGETNLIQWVETISTEGSGEADIIWLETLEGPPQPQIATQQTVCRATQSGQAIGLATWPDFPEPIWAEFEKPRLRRLAKKTPVRLASGLWQFESTWNYGFESGEPFTGDPTNA